MPDKKTLEGGVQRAYDATKIADARLRVESEAQERGYLSYFRRSVPGVRRGTDLELQNMLEHIRKGCYSDPLPPKEMSVAVNSDDDFPDYERMRATSQGESFNRQTLAGNYRFCYPRKRG